MDILPRMLSPSGSPIRVREIADWILSLLARGDQRGALIDSVGGYLGVRHCFSFSSGRAAMAALLSALRELSPDSNRDEVVVPGYTCYSVASSVAKAGLKLRVCDIDPQTLSYDLDELASVNFDRVLAVVSANLYGLPDDLPALELLAEREGVFLLDDAAQSLAARVAGRFSGTFGTAGMLSLDKGKNITAMQGGFVITNRDDLAQILLRYQSAMTSCSITENVKEYCKLLAYFLFLNPRLYWIPGGLPFLRLGETRYEEAYPVKQLPAGLAPIARAQFSRLESITAGRLEVASWYMESIPQDSRIRTIQPVRDAQPVYLRFPFRILNAGLRDRFLRECANLGVTGSYPRPIAEIPEVASRLAVHNHRYQNALAISREIVTMPTHEFVTRDDVDNITKALEKVLLG